MYVRPVHVFSPMNMRAFPVTSAAGKQVFLEGFQFLHDDPPAFRAETPDTPENLAVNQKWRRRKVSGRMFGKRVTIQDVNVMLHHPPVPN